MKLTILVDNNTFIDQYYHGEPAASFWLETEDKKILFDTGYSDILISNAMKMNIDLSQVTHIVFSHGHDDHTKGMRYLKDVTDLSKVKVIAHPECFLPKYNGELFIGSPFSEEEITEMSDYLACKEPFAITDRLIYLGHISINNTFESQESIGTY